MAEVRKILFIQHLRADASAHILYYRRGELRASGRGLAFWFLPLSASIAEIPVDQREQAFAFRGRSADFQDVMAQGQIVFRIDKPELLAERVDFTLDLEAGVYLHDPLAKLADFFSRLAHTHAWEYIASTPFKDILKEGQAQIRERIERAVLDNAQLNAMGLSVVSVALTAVKATADVERALEAPVREKIQQEADEATFARRAMAVEKERAIQENELQNRIELAKRQELLITQEGQNEKRKATEKTAALHIEATGQGERQQLLDEANARGYRAREEVRVELERERMRSYEGLAPQVVLALAAEQFATRLDKIQVENLNLSPDLLASLLTSLVANNGKRAKEEAA